MKLSLLNMDRPPLCSFHYPAGGRHPDSWRTYETQRRQHYLPHQGAAYISRKKSIIPHKRAIRFQIMEKRYGKLSLRICWTLCIVTLISSTKFLENQIVVVTKLSYLEVPSVFPLRESCPIFDSNVYTELDYAYGHGVLSKKRYLWTSVNNERVLTNQSTVSNAWAPFTSVCQTRLFAHC